MKNLLKLGTLALVASAIVIPAAANAQVWRREQTANEWRNIATISGALGVLGALNHDDTLTFVGAAGALYSGYRYNEDRKSIDRACNARAAFFDRDYFYRDGCRYEKRTVWQHGQRYYQFVNTDYHGNNRDRDWDRDRNWDRDHDRGRHRGWDRDDRRDRDDHRSRDDRRDHDRDRDRDRDGDRRH